METESKRSEEVVERYKKHKLGVSALHRISELVQGFERDRAADRRLAVIGMVLVAAVLIYLIFRFFGGEQIIVN